VQQHPAITCPFCGCGCGIYLVDCGSGHTRATGMRTHPVSGGRLCVRGWQVGDLATSFLQLQHPLIRRDGELVKSSYEDALAAAVELLNEAKSAEEPVWVIGATNITNEEAFATTRFAAGAVGADSRGCPARAADDSVSCWLQHSLGEQYLHPPLSALAECDVVLVLHSSLDTQHPQANAWVLRAQRAGATVIVLDEVCWDLGRVADLFVQLEPDGLGRALEFFVNGLRDPDSVNVDDSALSEALSLLAGAERAAIVASAAALPESSVAATAGTLATLLCGERSPSDTIYMMRSEANSLGTAVMGLGPDGSAQTDLWELLDAERSLAATVLVDGDLARFVGVEGFDKLRPKLGRLVVLSAFPSPTADLADVVLPVATVGKREGTVVSGSGRVWLMDLFTDPPGEARPVVEVLADLTRLMGGEPVGPDIEEVWRAIRSEIPACCDVDLEELRAGQEVYVDHDALPILPAPSERPLGVPDLANGSDEYSWDLIVRRDDNDRAYDPRVQAMALLARDMLRARVPYVALNPGDMAEMRIRPGRTVQITTQLGSAQAEARSLEGVPPSTILLPYHFGDLRHELAGPGEAEPCGNRRWPSLRASLTGPI